MVGAACTAPRARAPGAALAVVLLAAFVYAGLRIDASPQYQRPNWRGVAAALGTSASPRAIVAYDGAFATAPLAIYLPEVPWTGTGQVPQPGNGPVTVGELDIVGSTAQRLAKTLPLGTKLISSRSVDGYLVDRFSLAQPWRLTRAEIGARATTLLGPAPPGPAVLVENPSSAARGPSALVGHTSA